MKSIKYLLLALTAMLMSLASMSYVAPGKPVAASPSHGQVITDRTPLLMWTASAPATGTTIAGYQIQVSLVPDFSTPAPSTHKYTRPVSVQFTIPNADILEYGRTYYWRVRAKNNLGEWSEWSTADFRTAINKPTAVDPADGDTPATNPNLRDLRPTFRWLSSTGAQGFTLQVSQDCTFTTTIINVEIGSVRQYTIGTDLPAGTLLCWRVRANNSTYGSSDGWSNINTFRTATPPAAPVLVDPTDKTLTNDNSPKLDWSDVSSASHFEVQIQNSPDFTYAKHTKCDSASHYDNTRTFFPSASEHQIKREFNEYAKPAFSPTEQLLDACTYYWRVRSVHTYSTHDEYSVWSATRSLSTTVHRPTNLVVAIPPTDPRPLFKWDKQYHAELYRIIITSPEFPDPLVDTQVNLPRYIPTVDLPSNVDIYWKVYAIDAHRKYGNSLDSELQHFVSANAPSAPVLVKPALNAKITDRTPTFRWTTSVYPAGAYFDHYEIKISQNAKFTIGVITKSRLINSFTPTALLDKGRTYYWMVRTCTPTSECSSWSPISIFMIP